MKDLTEAKKSKAHFSSDKELNETIYDIQDNLEELEEIKDKILTLDDGILSKGGLKEIYGQWYEYLQKINRGEELAKDLETTSNTDLVLNSINELSEGYEIS
jgi:hypothetical protein